MDPNKNAINPTTVGGVTFGGAQPTVPAQPTAPVQPTAPSGATQGLESVDPIIESTGEEFDAVMNETPATPTVPSGPSGQAMANNLETTVTSPTHFDNQNTVRPVVQDPGVVGGMKKYATIEEKKEIETKKQIKKLSTMSMVFGILAAIFVTCSIVVLVLYISVNSKLTETDEKLKNYQSIVEAVEETTGVRPINTVADVPVYKATTGYIYLSSWNIKIRIPDNLTSVSYILNENYHPSICFNAIGKGVQYFPDFANIALNPGRMGCLTRIETTEGEFDAATGVSFGTKVFTYKDYSYFYTGSVDYSQDEANLGLEHTAVQYIKNMLTDNVEPYE